MEVGSLAARDTDLSELMRSKVEDNFRNNAGLATAKRDESGIDGGAGLYGQLLVEDAAGESVERRVETLESGKFVCVDHAGEIWVGGAEVAKCSDNLPIRGKRAGDHTDGEAAGGRGGGPLGSFLRGGNLSDLSGSN